MTNGEMATDKGTRDGRQKEKSRAQSILLVNSIHQLLNIISILNCLKKKPHSSKKISHVGIPKTDVTSCCNSKASLKDTAIHTYKKA